MVQVAALQTETAVAPQLAASRWLSVVTHLDRKYGGLSTVVPQLGSAITTAGVFGVSLAAFCLPYESRSLPAERQLPLTIWPTSRVAWLKDRSLATSFAHLLNDVEGLHIHGLWEQSTLVAARAARSRSLPYVLSAHGMLEPWALKNKRIKKAIYSSLVERSNVAGAACLHALTSQEAEDYRRYGVSTPIAIIPNGVQAPEHLSPFAFLARYPALRTKRLLLFLGRLHPKKGIDLLLRAWQSVTPRYKDAHLVLAGPEAGSNGSRIKQLIRQVGIADSVTLTGMLDEDLKWSALAASECFILPSYSEGLSVATLEAMAAGLPVIISHQCNLPEVARIGAGWTVETDLSSLSRAIADSLDHSPQTNARIGSSGLDFVRQHYNWTRIAQQMSEVYAWIQGDRLPASVEILRGGGVR